jgi:transposase
MRRHELSDEQWAAISAVLPPKGRGRPSILGERNFVNAVVWICKTGAPWRDLPERFGCWKTIFNRFSDWTKRGIWKAVFKTLALTDDEIGSLFDGSNVRAHQDSCGGRGGQKKTR